MKKIILLFWCLAPALVFAQENSPTSYFQVGGYAKADGIFSIYYNGDPGPESPIKDIHLPSAIPIGNGNRIYDTYFHVKESRFNFDLGGTIKGKPIRAFVELDFLLSKAGDERVSNSYNPRLREFYIEYDNLIIGQTWSNFMILIIPEDLDFAGAAEGIVFNRQPQIKLTLGTWQFSLENPEAFLTPNGGGAYLQSSGSFPDATARKNFSGEWGTASVAGIVRTIRIWDAQGENHITPGFGISAGSRLNIGSRDDLRFMVTGGSGLGRYVALGFINAGILEQNSDIKLIPSFNAYVSYLHYWTENWKSSVNISGFTSSNDTGLSGVDVNKSAFSVSGNLIYQVTPELMFGGEAMYGYRNQESDVSGAFLRFQFSAKYSFKFRSELAKKNG